MLFQDSNQATHCRVVGADISEAAKPRARGMAFPAEGTADAKAFVVGGWGGERARPAAPSPRETSPKEEASWARGK